MANRNSLRASFPRPINKVSCKNNAIHRGVLWKRFFTFISFMIVPQSLTTPDMQKFDINNGDVQ